MKSMKSIMAAALTLVQLSAFAATDPIEQNVLITQDAVKVALEEFAQTSGENYSTPDSQLKTKRLAKDVEVALIRYEKRVREEIISSFRVLVNQYNSALINPNLSFGREQVLSGIASQLGQLSMQKGIVYGQIVKELFSVLPDLPYSLEVVKRRSDNDCFLNYSSTKTPVEKLTRKGREYQDYCSNYWNYRQAEKFTGSDQNRRPVHLSLLEGCYSSTCFFETQASLLKLNAHLGVNLSKPIILYLNDKQKVVVAVPYDRITHDILAVSNLGEFMNLPPEVSDKRVEKLDLISTELKNKRPNCKVVKELKQDLCTQTQEGCLAEIEKALLNKVYPNTCLK